MDFKRIFSFILLLIVSNGFGQFTLLNNQTGNQINEGDIVTVSTNDLVSYLTITNTHTSDINLSAVVLNMVNTDGSEGTWCFGVNNHGSCYFGMSIGDVKQGGAPLPVGASTNATDIDIKHSDGSSATSTTNYPKDYVYKIEATDASTNNVLGSITFTYRYDPSGAVDDFNKNNFNVFASGKQLVVNTKQAVDVTIYNLSGQEIKTISLAKGVQYVDMNSLPAGIYMVLAQKGTHHIYKKIILQ